MLFHSVEFSFFFLRLNNISVCVCVYFFFIHSFIDECLGCFHILAVVNRAAMDMAVLIPLQDPFLGVRAHAMQQAGS